MSRHIQNPVQLWHIQNQRHIQNPGIIKSLPYLEPEAYLEPCQTSTLTTIIIFANYNYFCKISFSGYLLYEINIMNFFNNGRILLQKYLFYLKMYGGRGDQGSSILIYQRKVSGIFYWTNCKIFIAFSIFKLHFLQQSIKHSKLRLSLQPWLHSKFSSTFLS